MPREEFNKLSDWFTEFEAQMWDQQIEDDLKNGKLKALIDEAEEEFATDECKAL